MYKTIDVLNETKGIIDAIVSDTAIVEINMQPILSMPDIKKTIVLISGGGVDQQQINRVQCDETMSVFIRLIVPLVHLARERVTEDCCNANDLARKIARTLATRKTLGGARLSPNGKIIVFNADDDPIFDNVDKKQCYAQIIRVDLLDRYSAVHACNI